jgi:hypothetical protein
MWKSQNIRNGTSMNAENLKSSKQTRNNSEKSRNPQILKNEKSNLPEI